MSLNLLGRLRSVLGKFSAAIEKYREFTELRYLNRYRSNIISKLPAKIPSNGTKSEDTTTNVPLKDTKSD